MFVCGAGLGRAGEGVWLGLCIAFGATSLLLWRRFVADLMNVGAPTLAL